ASPDAPLLERARLRCALAFEHAGRLDEAVDVLPEQIEDARLGPELAVVASVVRLGAAIDREDWADCDARSAQLDAHLDSCGQTERARVLGVARGAQGRALLHQRRVSDAIARFHEAIAWHREAQRHELARSRVHLASALRVAGDPSAALRELDAARLDLAITRERSRPYAATTEMFLHYEQARALLDAGRVDEARYTAEAALRRAGVRGFWPQLGVLRVLAWAHAQLGDTAAAAVAIDRMRRLAVPPAHEGLRDRLLTEAEAGPGDVIY
ncbi:MAG: hypothetical protein JNK45_12100, partial [Myxococcales bacterium]|nr:hypothetical protein [Myxococcales bacterium]